MRVATTFLTAVALLTPALVTAQAQPMADAQYTRTAASGGPEWVSANAAIVRFDAQGTVTTLRAGTNGFSCFVGVPGDPDAPVCGDQNAVDWILSAVKNLPKPTNAAPGICYMAQGGVHHETATRDVVMMPGTNTHPVKEPPHWMVMWAFDPAASGLPTKENPGGVYIMFAGTPYAHLMIYQNPNTMKPQD